MSIEITESELQAIMDDIRSNHESDELIAMLANDIPAPPRPTLLRSITESNDIPEPLSRPTLLRSITESNDIPEPLSRPTLLRSITESNDIPAPPRPTLLRSTTNDFLDPLPRPTLARATTNDFPAPLLPLPQCANDSPEPNPSDDELPPSQLETAFSGLPDRLPTTAEEVDEIMQGFRKAL